MSQGARDLVSDSEEGKKNSDGYKPTFVPNALKVINGHMKNSMEVGRDEKMQIDEELKVEEHLEDITGLTCIYVPVRDVYKTAQWYEKNLGCKLREGDKMEPGMTGAIMRFPDFNGQFPGPGLRQTVPAVFLIESRSEGGRLGFTNNEGVRHAVGCFITPRIQDLFERFKENGVNIAGDIGMTCGPNLQFFDPDGNMWEVWQP